MTGASSHIDESTVGDTPLIELDLDWGLTVDAPTIYAKVEWFNCHNQGYGGGSIKSRIGVRMIEGAERRGELTDQIIIEPTSGNTGVALARVGHNRGYDVRIVMPDDAAQGKIEAIRAVGGEIDFVPGERSYEAKLERTQELVDGAGFYWPNQYDNPDNYLAHQEGTGPEFWNQTDGDLTHALVGIGTGGTVTGVGRALHERGDVTVIGIEPSEDPHTIEGLRFFREKGYIHTGAYDKSVLDSRRLVDTETAWQAARDLRDHYEDRKITIHDTGQYDKSLVREKLRVGGEFVVGPSSGAAVAMVRRLLGEGSIDASDSIGMLLCDRGDRYFESLWPEFSPDG